MRKLLYLALLLAAGGFSVWQSNKLIDPANAQQRAGRRPLSMFMKQGK